MQELLKQPQYRPMQLDKQVMSLWSAGNGFLDKVPVTAVKQWEADMHAYMDSSHPEVGQEIMRSKDLTDSTIEALRLALTDFNNTWTAPA
jgi:F-type H+-transporting ATPase subunit alpha